MTIRIGLIGAGFIGQMHARNIRSRLPQFDLAVIADPDPASRAAVSEAFRVPTVADWRELAHQADLAAVLIASPSEDHPTQVVAFAEAGKHVYCEKPLALTLDEADAALSAVDQAGTILQVGFNRRFDPHFRRLHQTIEDGRIGRPLLIRITSRDPALPPASYVRAPGKMFIDTTIHDFDMARFLADADIVAVSAFSGALIDELADTAGDADTAAVMLRFSSGAIGVIDNCRQAPYGYDQRAEVHGTLGLARADNVLDTTASVADAQGFHAVPLPTFFPERYAESFLNALTAFASAIRGDSPVQATGQDSRAALAAALAAQESHVGRHVVTPDAVTLDRLTPAGQG